MVEDDAEAHVAFHGCCTPLTPNFLVMKCNMAAAATHVLMTLQFHYITKNLTNQLHNKIEMHLVRGIEHKYICDEKCSMP